MYRDIGLSSWQFTLYVAATDSILFPERVLERTRIITHIMGLASIPWQLTPYMVATDSIPIYTEHVLE